MRERLIEYDLLRIFAALAVIAIHVTARYDLNSSLLVFVGNQATRNAVPMFIIMSGFVLYFADQKKWLPVQLFLHRRFGRVLNPYIIWTTLYVVGTAVFYRQFWPNIQTFLVVLGKHLLFGTGFFHLYFLIIIFQLYLLYPLLRIWLKDHATSLLLISFILTLTGQTLVYLHELQLVTLPYLGFLYCTLFPLWLFYFVLGMYMAAHTRQMASLVHNREWWLGLLTLLSLGIVLADSYYTQTFIAIKPSLILYTVLTHFFLYSLALRWKETFKKWEGKIRWLANQSFLIYLLHPLVLSVLFFGMPSHYWANPSRQLWQGDLAMIILYVLVVLISTASCYIVSLTPVASLLGGVRKTK
jgi:peptidoglycan/LPS O-acetylase OafA/YrhL